MQNEGQQSEAALAEQFIEAVWNCKNWDKPTLSKRSLKVVSDTLRSAGFEVEKITPGFWVIYDNESLENREQHPHPWCPYRVHVTRPRLNGDWDATGWLNDMFIALRRSTSKPRGEVVEMVVAEIIRARPLPPITITADGDELCEPEPYTRFAGFLIDHRRDETSIYSQSRSAGYHRYCEGEMHVGRATADRNALYCGSCNLRVMIPMSIETYGQLRAFFNTALEGSPALAKAA